MKDALRTLLDRVSPAAMWMWWVSLAVVVAAILAPGMGPPDRLGLDKVAHFVAFGGLGLLAALVMGRRAHRWALAALVGAAIGSEFAQMLVSSRAAMAADAAANLAGLTLGTVVGRALLNSVLRKGQSSGE